MQEATLPFRSLALKCYSRSVLSSHLMACPFCHRVLPDWRQRPNWDLFFRRELFEAAYIACHTPRGDDANEHDNGQGAHRDLYSVKDIYGVDQETRVAKPGRKGGSVGSTVFGPGQSGFTTVC